MPKLRLYYPIRPYLVGQRFGENMACVKDFGFPYQKITGAFANGVCPPDYEKLYPMFGMAGHNGLDLHSDEKEVRAACDGVVVEKQDVPARGLGVGILTNEQYDFGIQGIHYIKLRYWHLKSFNCEVGDCIKVGDVIGRADNTGYSGGNHLHFEGQPIDKDAGGHPKLANPVGSIAGAIDIEPYFTGIYADVYARTLTLTQKLVELLQAIIIQLKSK